MLARPPHHRYTFREYLALERMSPIKHEFYDGEIYAMAGGTIEHAALAGEMIRLLGNQLQGGPRRVYSSDLRVRVVETGLTTYPDVAVVCGPPERDPEDPRTTVVNPKIVVEVLSASTEDYDRGDKLDHYRRVPSLEGCVLVSQEERLVELWARESDGVWRRSERRSGGVVEIASIGCRIDVKALYDGAVGAGALA